MYKQNLFKHLLSILAVVSITSFAGVGASYAAGDEADENSGTGSTETPTGSDPVGAATGIKIATKSFNDARFSYVRRDLDETIATIRDVVSNAITNTNNIAALQDGKQTRPDDNHACAEGKTCLLVTDTSGTRNWYEIIDCNKNAFFSNMGAGVGSGAKGGKYCDDGYNASASGYRDCTGSEWGHLYEKGMVYGVARAVAIAEAPGTVVTLPGNVAVGDTCVCRVTGYAPLVSGTFAGNNAVYASTPTSFTTDKWVVGGKISTYYTSAPGTAMTDANCVDVCGFGTGDNGALKAMYFASVSNTCMASASEAQMCRYHEFFNTVVSGGQYGRVGSVDVGSDGWGACIQPTTGYFSTGHCVDGGWVIEYTFNGGTQSGYVWGRAGYVTLPQGTSVGDVVDITNANDFSLTSSPSHNAYVCIVDGYRGINASSDQTLGFTKAYVAQIDGSNSVIGSLNATGCAEWAQNPSAAANHLGGYYTDLAEVCDVY